MLRASCGSSSERIGRPKEGLVEVKEARNSALLRKEFGELTHPRLLALRIAALRCPYLLRAACSTRNAMVAIT
jgi:hypothetical protein